MQGRRWKALILSAVWVMALTVQTGAAASESSSLEESLPKEESTYIEGPQQSSGEETVLPESSSDEVSGEVSTPPESSTVESSAGSQEESTQEESSSETSQEESSSSQDPEDSTQNPDSSEESHNSSGSDSFGENSSANESSQEESSVPDTSEEESSSAEESSTPENSSEPEESTSDVPEEGESTGTPGPYPDDWAYVDTPWDQISDEACAGVNTPRDHAPLRSNSFYFSNWNIYYAAGFGMPNCTAYAYGRSYERLGEKPRLSSHNAGEWWFENIANGWYAYGSKPRVGAVACWDKWDQNQGHVAVVEKIDGGRVTLSESGYQSFMFRTTEMAADSSDYLTGGYRFLGYIYVESGQATSSEGAMVSSGLTVNSSPVIEYLETDPQPWQVCAAEGVNLRGGYGLEEPVLALIPDGTRLAVLQTVIQDGYTWGKVVYERQAGWCVLDFGRGSQELGLRQIPE